VLTRDAITRGCWGIRLMISTEGGKTSVYEERTVGCHTVNEETVAEASELSYLLF